jgi:tryprostatin B 6-hydroxylase
MGDLAFGKSFDMLKKDEEHWAIALMNTGLEALAFLFPTWLFRVLIAIPGLLKDHARIVEFCNNQLDERIKVGNPISIVSLFCCGNANSNQTKVDTPDIMSTLLSPFPDRPPMGEDLSMLQGDSRLIVIAGR